MWWKRESKTLSNVYKAFISLDTQNYGYLLDGYEDCVMSAIKACTQADTLSMLLVSLVFNAL